MAEGDYPNSILNAHGFVDCAASGYADCNTYTDNSTWTYDYYYKRRYEGNEKLQNEYLKDVLEQHKKSKKIEGVDIMILYDVYLVYAEDRKNPIVINKFGVIARDEEDAKIKSGLMKEVQDEWDADYLNFICKEIGDVKVKAKPKEVKTVK